MPATPTKIAPAARVPKLFKKLLRSGEDDESIILRDDDDDLAGATGAKARMPCPARREEIRAAERKLLRGLIVDGNDVVS